MSASEARLQQSSVGDVYERNIRALETFHPLVYAQLDHAMAAEEVQVYHSTTGEPVPVIRSLPLHSLDDPRADAKRMTEAFCAQPQQRATIFGFGFGYHLEPIIQAGFSPTVYEPSAATFRLALRSRDLTGILRHIDLHVAPSVPDVPRGSIIVALPGSEHLYPGAVAEFRQRIVPGVDQAVGFERGVYYSSYRNITCLKNPCDLAIYQMLLWEIRPTLILEFGALRGGSALYFADLLRLMGGDRRVHTYDIDGSNIAPQVLSDPNITFHLGGYEAFEPSVVRSDDRVLVIDDAAHSYECTKEILQRTARFVTPNSYMIVEDTLAGSTRPHLNGGPIRAIDEFLATTTDFDVDARWETFYGSENTNNARGFLRRRA
ncbi:MAG: hypothetical protein IT290_01585 [Deltaproteobacteria bacterium]|nr:hypothetical protein [Deltaproteobacteria bacterium]